MADEKTLYREPVEATTARVKPAAARSRDEAWVPAEGSIVAERYRVGEVIGAGGMGAVVRAERLRLGEHVAIKFLHPRLAADPDSEERFLREAKATSRVRNEHVVRIIDVGTTDGGIPYMVMDLLEGEDLGALVARGPLSITDAVDYVLQAAEALAEAHAAGIVHRDIKPSNLWLTRRSDGSALVKVLDFGISKLSPAGGEDSKLTETSAVFGSPTYMSPEQIRSAKKVDARTDVWSLGVVLHELLTLRQPFEAESVAGVLAAISADRPIPLRAARPDAPPTLERAILACLEKDVARRVSLGELALMLQPMASAAGSISGERLARMGMPGASMRPPAPSSEHAQAFAVTDKSMSTAATQAVGTAPVRRPFYVAAIVLLLFVLGGGAFAAKGSKHKALETKAQPTAVAAAASSPPVVAATAEPPVAVAPPLPAPPLVPTALVSATSRPSRAPRTPRAPASVAAGAPTTVAPEPPPPPSPPPSPTSEGRK